LHRPRLLQADANREHGEDQHQNAPIDRFPCFLGVNASQQQDEGDPKHGQAFDRHDVQGRKQNDACQRGDRYRGLLAAEAAGPGLRDVDEVRFLRGGGQAFRCALQKEAVGGPKLYRLEVEAGKVAMAADPQETDSEAAEPHIADRTQVAAARGQHRFNDGVMRAALAAADAENVEAALAVQCEDLGHAGLNDDTIACLKDVIGQVPAA